MTPTMVAGVLTAVLPALLLTGYLLLSHNRFASQATFEEELGGAVRTLVAVAESYPGLQASANYLHLQRELTDTENGIAAGRRFYNGNVRALNTRVRTFPSNLVASTFGFEEREFFELTDAAGSRSPVVGP
jgi:LemA protein